MGKKRSDDQLYLGQKRWRIKVEQNNLCSTSKNLFGECVCVWDTQKMSEYAECSFGAWQKRKVNRIRMSMKKKMRSNRRDTEANSQFVHQPPCACFHIFDIIHLMFKCFCRFCVLVAHLLWHFPFHLDIFHFRTMINDDDGFFSLSLGSLQPA